MSRAENSWNNDIESVPEGLWYGRYQRAMNGLTGLRRLEEMKVALEALPKKELCEGTVSDGETVCFVGAFIAKRRAAKLGLPLLDVIVELHERAVAAYGEGDDSYENLSTTAESASDAGLPWTVAWEWASLNDAEWRHLTNTGRYEKAMVWVEGRIATHPLRHSTGER